MKKPEKEALNWMGELAIVHCTGKDTGGKYTIIELYATKEGSPPWHIHHREDEGFFVINGEMTISVGDKTYEAKEGDFLLVPKGVPHTYSIKTPGYVRILMICLPAGFEDLVRALSTPAATLIPPAPGSTNIDYEHVMKTASQFGVEFVEAPTNT